MKKESSIITLRVDKSDLEIIQENVKKSGKSRNAYIIERSLNYKDNTPPARKAKISPALMCKLNEVCNMLDYLDDEHITMLKNDIRKELSVYVNSHKGKK